MLSEIRVYKRPLFLFKLDVELKFGYMSNNDTGMFHV